MAALPPRKNATPTKLSKLSLSPLQVLLQMGFTKNRAEKALAATGYRNVQLASDWLLAHVNDPSLDEFQPREYLLYMVPAGNLHIQLQKFWAQSMAETGGNGAHDFMPHITLIPPFKVPDDAVSNLLNLVERIVEEECTPKEINLETYISQNFMGFFVNEEQASAFKNIASLIVKELTHLNISADITHHQGLHLTLAYNFASSQFNTLETLVKGIDSSSSSHWQLRLYSRDARLVGKKVYRVVYPHVPRETDELELLLGDFVYVDSEAWTSSVDGWIEGISWLTGCSGFLPKNYVEKTAESDAWTLHKTFELNSFMEDLKEAEKSVQVVRKLLSRRIFPEQSAIVPSANNIEVVASLTSTLERPLVAAKSSLRRIFIVRHGERVDFTFGTWIPYCFDESGRYMRKDLNMPLSVPRRQGSPDSFNKDTPLTLVGETQARLLGQGLKLAGIDTIRHVYCSPSLRSLQTCQNILKGLEVEHNIPIGLEPGLFEWLVWYADGIPQFMTIPEMLDAGFNLKVDHQHFVDFKELVDRRESGEQYYMRSHYVTQCALRSTQHLGGDVLLVGHASTLDACSRQLIGRAPRSAQELSRIVHRIPYCSLAVVQQIEKEEEAEDKEEEQVPVTQKTQDSWWKLVEPPVPPITYSANVRYDWTTLLQHS